MDGSGQRFRAVACVGPGLVRVASPDGALAIWSLNRRPIYSPRCVACGRTTGRYYRPPLGRLVDPHLCPGCVASDLGEQPEFVAAALAPTSPRAGTTPPARTGEATRGTFQVVGRSGPGLALIARAGGAPERWSRALRPRGGIVCANCGGAAARHYRAARARRGGDPRLCLACVEGAVR